MTSHQVAELVRQALLAAFWVSLPLLLVGFVASVVVSLVQIVTSMQDPVVGTIPRLAAFLVAILVFLPWMLSRMIGYTTALLGDLGPYAR